MHLFAINSLYGTLAVAKAIRSEYSTDCGVQWLRLKSAEHGALVDILSTVPAHRLGHQNGRRVRCICFDCVLCLFEWDPGSHRVIQREYSTNCGVQ